MKADHSRMTKLTDQRMVQQFLRCGRSGKFIHPSRSSASRHLKRRVRTDNYQGNVYRCSHCQGWHVGGLR